MKRKFGQLCRQLGVATAIMVPASIFIGLISALVFTTTSPSMEKILLPALCSWGFLVMMKTGHDVGNLMSLACMVLPYFIYAWIWTIGRFLGVKLWLMISIILALQVTGGLLLLSLKV